MLEEHHRTPQSHHSGTQVRWHLGSSADSSLTQEGTAGGTLLGLTANGEELVGDVKALSSPTGGGTLMEQQPQHGPWASLTSDTWLVVAGKA